ncbi:MAG TPA: cyclase family protein [Candidatus Paceibacterota bacterium]
MQKIIDISLPLNNHTIIYPGNASVTLETHAQMPESSSHLSKIIMGSHSGTHVDAPLHTIIGGATVDTIPLETFFGPCRVINFTSSKEAITLDDIKRENIKKGERILAKTSNSERGFEKFYGDYIYLDGDAADYLGELGITLFGIDYISVKKRGSKDNRSHTSLLSKNIPIIEGINLKDVPVGIYKLICLPLKFIGLEGAPARAILLK